jgi:hypothetical protein
MKPALMILDFLPIFGSDKLKNIVGQVTNNSIEKKANVN